MTSPQHPLSLSYNRVRANSKIPTSEDMTNDTMYDDRKRKANYTTNFDDAIDDEVAAHLSASASHKARTQSPKKVRMTTHNGCSSNLHPSPMLPYPPPFVQRSKEQQDSIETRVGGFDPTSLAWLQCMEEIATVWLNMLVQQQNLFQIHHPDNLFKEKKRIIDFCTRTLQQILSEGGFRSYTTPSYSPSLYSQPLPPLQDLPLMVVTLKYWYTTLLSRCQHQTAVGMLPHRVLAPQQLSRISVSDYIRACEEEVKRWLRDFVTSDPTTTNGTTTTEKLNDSRSQVAVWMHQLHTKAVPTYSPVKPKPIMKATTQSKQLVHNQTKGESRMPSPTDVMMFDKAMSQVSAIKDSNANDDDSQEDKKPPAKLSTESVPSTKSAIKKYDLSTQPVAHRTTISKEKANRMRGLILSLYHANKCPFNKSENGDDRCPVSKGCHTVKELWNHITLNRSRRCCVENTCAFSSLSLEAEEALLHYGQCKKETCPICGPVLLHMPKVKSNIKAAVEGTKRHAAAFEEAILHVVDEISNEMRLPKSNETKKSCTKMTSKPDTTIPSK
jgi:hypothetical protein